MPKTITLAVLTVALLAALVATVAFGNVYDSRLQMESEETPPPEDMLDGARMIFGAIALAALAFGLLALWGGK